MIGTTVASGRYELVAVLGEGAQGTTFEAVDRQQGKRVAIKRFSVRGAKSWKDVELAEREASVLASLSHPHLPKYLAHFEEDGALYLVMDKIEGKSLAELMQEGAVLDRAEVVRFLADAAEVLGYLRDRAPPVIHRDINPKNVVRRPDGSFVVVDFGAVRDRLKAQGSTVVGTFGYMAPEQFQGRALPASDVYAVGATALTLLCRTEPENLPHRGLSIDVAAALSGRRDRDLVRVLERMLEPDPDRRLSDLSELRSLASGRPEAAPSRPPTPARQRERDRRREKRQRREERRRQRHAGPKPPLMPGLLVFALLGLAVASIVVSAVLLVAVPVVLTLLSVFFGSRLRDAAGAVRRAGYASNRALGRARDNLLARRIDDEPASAPVERQRVDERFEARVRVDGEAEPPSEEAEDDEQSAEPPRRHGRRAT
jgi:serine/threonine protein kinase